MKIIALGDIHGRSLWKDILSKDFDKAIFCGDYFDARDNISAAIQKHNFKEIIEFKRTNSDKVVLLIGNHDFHYMKGVNENYSNYQYTHAVDFQILLQEALDDNMLKICHLEGDTLFSHAGFTKTWCKNNDINPEIKTIEQETNDLFKYKPRRFGFTMGHNFSKYGNDTCQTPIWVRPMSLFLDKIDWFKQVVGHTIMENISENEGLYFIDTLGTSGEYLEINDGVFSISKL